jgi:tetratricopeptide (TPR) repeat protein
MDPHGQPPSPPRKPEVAGSDGSAQTIQRLLDAAKDHYEAGQLAEAEQLYLQVLVAEPQHADSRHFLGIIAYRAGRHAEAVEWISRAIQIKRDDPSYHNNLGNAFFAQGKLEDAAACYRRALILRPEFAEAYVNLGNALKAQGKTDEAVRNFEHALALRPELAEAHNNLGNALRDLGRPEDAVRHFERALALRPELAEAHNNLANALRDLGKLDEAVAPYRRALSLRPQYAEAHNNLGAVFQDLGKLEQAAACCHLALSYKPEFAEAHYNLGNALQGLGRLEEAVACFQRALALQPQYLEALNNLGNALRDLGRLDDAMESYGRALAHRPAFAQAHYNRSGVKTFRTGDPELKALEVLVAEAEAIPPREAIYFHFALAKALEDVGDYRRAFEQMRIGNELKRRQISYDGKAVARFFQRIAEVFDAAVFERLGGAGDPSSVPVFVLGMPRSGSSLIEQILSSHPQVHGAGELSNLHIAAGALSADHRSFNYPEYVPALDGVRLQRLGQSYLAGLPAVAAGKTRIIDKSPANFLYVGLIRLILPNAKIIHSIRDPLDTCVSCYSILFTSGSPFSYDLAELGRYYKSYTELMAHWHSILPARTMLDVGYDHVVDDLEGQARRMIDYCGLPWDDRCLEFEKNRRAVRTASSVQVRKPLYRTSLERWRRYEPWLSPLLRELSERP